MPIPFIAIIPFGQIQLPRIDSYTPVVDTVISITDFIAAMLLLAQFSIMRSPSLLALAGGFLFTAFVIVPCALTFPGAFVPNGLLGARPETTAWLNVLWFLGLPLAVIAYVLLQRVDSAKPIPRGAIPFAILTLVIALFLVTCALVWLTTDGIEYLPVIMSETGHPQLAWDFNPLVVFSIIAIALLWFRRQSLLDLWLLLILEAWMLNALLFNRLVMRWSVIWYCGRVFSILAIGAILLFLLSETTLLYWRLARSYMVLERERENKLISAQAITAVIAHEIRQPLTAITTNAAAALRFLAQTPSNYDEVRAALDTIRHDGHRTAEMFDGIRDLFSSVGHPDQMIDVNEIIIGVIQSLERRVKDHRVMLDFELAAKLPRIKGDSRQLQEVMFNLINNAIEAMDSTADRSRVLHVETAVHGPDSIAIAVKDSGAGIDPNRLEDVFGAFFTTKTRGTGLGLAICRMIVERHGGRLTAFSDGKSGALFQVILPIEPSA